MKIARIVSVAALALLVAPAALAAGWRLDPDHSSVEFSVKHLQFFDVTGKFGEFGAEVTYDPENPERLSVDATVQTASIDTGVGKRDDHLRSADFFEVARFPTMRFVSKRALEAEDGSMRLVGNLTIRDVTREVTFDLGKLSPVIRDPWGNRRVGATATTVIDRTEFGLTWNETLEAGGLVVGNEVRITLHIQLISPVE